MDRKNLCLVSLLVGVVALLVIQEAKAAINTKYLGCFNGKPYRDNGGSFREGKINWVEMWNNFTTIVQLCANRALQDGHDYFAVHYWGECYVDQNPARYKQYKSSTQCYGLPGPGMVGDHTASAIYHINKTCSGGKNDGDKWIEEKYDAQVNSIVCQKFQCAAGAISKLSGRMACHYDNSHTCEKYIPSNNCCDKKCACVHNNVAKMIGDVWTKNIGNSCYECRCNPEGNAFCESPILNCPSKDLCPLEIAPPGKCCATCPPRAPTTRPWEIITTRPPPVFPWGKKRSYKKKRFDWSPLN